MIGIAGQVLSQGFCRGRHSNGYKMKKEEKNE